MILIDFGFLVFLMFRKLGVGRVKRMLLMLSREVGFIYVLELATNSAYDIEILPAFHLLRSARGLLEVLQFPHWL